MTPILARLAVPVHFVILSDNCSRLCRRSRTRRWRSREKRQKIFRHCFRPLHGLRRRLRRPVLALGLAPGLTVCCRCRSSFRLSRNAKQRLESTGKLSQILDRSRGTRRNNRHWPSLRPWENDESAMWLHGPARRRPSVVLKLTRCSRASVRGNVGRLDATGGSSVVWLRCRLRSWRPSIVGRSWLLLTRRRRSRRLTGTCFRVYPCVRARRIIHRRITRPRGRVESLVEVGMRSLGIDRKRLTEGRLLSGEVQNAVVRDRHGPVVA